MKPQGWPPVYCRRVGGPVARRLLVGTAVLLCGGASAQSLSVNGEASLVSDLTERGVSLWPREVAVQGLLALSDGAHWSAALTLSAPLEHARNYQAVARTGAYWNANEHWQLQARLGAYAYPGGGYYRFYDRIDRQNPTPRPRRRRIARRACVPVLFVVRARVASPWTIGESAPLQRQIPASASDQRRLCVSDEVF